VSTLSTPVFKVCEQQQQWFIGLTPWIGRSLGGGRAHGIVSLGSIPGRCLAHSHCEEGLQFSPFPFCCLDTADYHCDIVNLPLPEKTLPFTSIRLRYSWCQCCCRGRHKYFDQGEAWLEAAGVWWSSQTPQEPKAHLSFDPPLQPPRSQPADPHSYRDKASCSWKHNRSSGSTCSATASSITED